MLENMIKVEEVKEKEINMEYLEEIFNCAIASDLNYVAVAVKIDDQAEAEIIINTRANFESKLEYYKNTYNADLVHKYSPNIKIVSVTTANEIQTLVFNLL